ncbi:hypothetical protein ACFFLZ_05045 [Photobacterium aphoticum]|uniref:Uncharacterized protein n=1 Tax=Photobacterium aphoticum TaxID=754436 RepID=A0A0J1GQ65_9GAMM|nr:hypothetical protein [Photobacterium aphoticum]KLV01781.1 hypothetical protein ABT58_04955 [Photobacterium aphoticum]PSU58734.1 hypothetical protein C9I90_05805 [Photobacterium aphoticum]GHA32404.1 hypothetical protein GCM10007086_01910 [Photobacterium aphoticum]
MRKTHIALLVAVVSSPLALANSYYDPYNPYYDDGNDKTITDSFNKDLDATLTKSIHKEYNIEKTYKSDDDTLKMYDVNNTDKHEYINNSTHDYSQDWTLKIEENWNTAESKLDGSVAYSKVSYGGACCEDHGGYYGKGYGAPSSPSSLTVSHHNDMSGAFSGASGINIAGQNAGNNSLVQQSASTNAMLAGN